MNFDDYFIIMPAKIVEYFPEEQLATVSISNNVIYSTSTDDDLQVAPQDLYDVPVHTPGGGGWHMTFPIKPGDSCLLNFSQFGYNHWFYDNEQGAKPTADGFAQPWTKRVFSPRDGFAQVGFNNIPTAISDYSATDSEWRNSDREQHISLLEDGNIYIKTGTTTINLAPSGAITVNTDTSVDVTAGSAVSVTAPSVDVDCDSAVITASASVDLATPTTNVSGVLNVTGLINGAGGMAIAGGSGAVVTGPISSTAEVSGATVVAGAVDLGTHVHPGDGGTGSEQDTGAPI